MKEIITERLILRPWKITDSNDLYEYAQSEKVGPNAGWKPHKSEEESKGIVKLFIENNDTYAIVLKDENKVIGSIGLHDRQPDEILKDLNQREVGYVLSPKYWGQGLMPEAVKAVLDYGFNEMKLDLMWCGHFDFNNNSKRVVEKIGFNYKFTKKTTMSQLENKEVNLLFYNIFKEEYNSLNK